MKLVDLYGSYVVYLYLVYVVNVSRFPFTGFLVSFLLNLVAVAKSS